MAIESDAMHLANLLQTGLWTKYMSEVKVAYGVSEDKIWEQLAKHHPGTFNVFDALSALSSQDKVAACRWVLPIVGQLSHLSLPDAKQLLSFAEILDLSYRYKPAEQLRPHISARPELGRELGEYLRSGGATGDASVSAWAAAFAGGAPEAAAAYLAKLLTGTDLDSRLAAVLTTFLPFDNEKVHHLVVSLEPALADAVAGSATVLGSVAWTAICQIAGQSVRATTILQDALQAGIPDAIIAIANSFYQIGPAAVGVTGAPIEELVSSLLQIGLADDSVRHYIDAAVDSLFFRQTFRPVATQSIMKLGAVENNVVAAFPEVFGALASHRDEFAVVLTDWLLSPDTNFASLASLISMCVNHRAPIVLDEAAFAAQSSERRVKAARRLLAFTHHGPTLCQFCVLIAEMSTLGSERFKLSGEMLDNTFIEYPGATEEFLKAKTSTHSRRAPEMRVYQQIYNNVLQWREVLEQLPKRKELLPSDSELQVLRARKRRINREIMRMADEQSIFAGLAAKLHMAQGRKFASHTPFGAPQITHMVESSHFVELPSSELADPMRGEIRRRQFIRNAR